MKATYELTDPASEISALFEEFASIEALNTDTTQNVLSSYFECDPSSAEWYELVGTIASRIRSLREFIVNVDNRFVKEKMRSQTLVSLDHMNQFVGPQQMTQKWATTKANLFSDAHIARLESFAPIAEKYRPLRKLSDKEREAILEKLDAILLLIDEDHEKLDQIPEWAVVPIVDGIKNLRRLIGHLRFFGHQAAIEAVLNLSIKVDSIAVCDLPEEQKKDLFSLIQKTMHVMFFVGEVLLLPANAYQGYHVYKEIALQHLIDQKEEKLALVDEKANQKLLPPPEDKVTSDQASQE
jgi:hypothetical protein